MKTLKFGSTTWLLGLILVPAYVVADEIDGDQLYQDSLVIEHANEPWTGDLDEIIDRRFIRVVTAYNPLFFSYDGIGRRGLAVEVANEFDKWLNETYENKGRSINVVLMPVARDEILPYLMAGKADVAAANLTITPQRQKLASFSDPTYPDVRELVVTGPAAPEIKTWDDLASTKIHLRKSSSYFEHLSALNKARSEQEKSQIQWQEADEHLEDYDLLEMMNASLIPAVIVDSHKAELWAQVFDNIHVHESLVVHSGNSIAWAVRKDNPKLLGTLNEFVKIIRKGTLLGNILLKRYLVSTEWIDNIRSKDAVEKYEATIEIIKRFANKYGFDSLMIVAQGYQESTLDQTKRSSAGAIGVMQLLPSTAADKNVGIPDIHEIESNVHAGVKYLRHLRSHYFSGDEIAPLDQVLFSFAAHNAGPGNIAKARKQAKKIGFNPNIWFGHVEVAAARTISSEPVIYVRHIYKYYVAYKQIAEVNARRGAARHSEQ